jgi:hypothetical protein
MTPRERAEACIQQCTHSAGYPCSACPECIAATISDIHAQFAAMTERASEFQRALLNSEEEREDVLRENIEIEDQLKAAIRERDDARVEAAMYKKAVDVHFTQRDKAERERDEAIKDADAMRSLRRRMNQDEDGRHCGFIGGWIDHLQSRCRLLESERDEARAELDRHLIADSELIAGLNKATADLAQRDWRIAELEAQLTEARNHLIREGMERDAVLKATTEEEYHPEDDARPCSTCNMPGNCHVDSPLNRDHAYAPAQPTTTAKEEEPQPQWERRYGRDPDYGAAPPSPAARDSLGDELRKHERYLNREISYDERHAAVERMERHNEEEAIFNAESPAAREAEERENDAAEERLQAPFKSTARSVISSNRPYSDADFVTHIVPKMKRVIEAARDSYQRWGDNDVDGRYERLGAALAALDAARSKEAK